MARRPNHGAEIYAMFIDALMTHPHSVLELVEETGCNRNTINDWIVALRRPWRSCLYIADYLDDRNKTARYMLGKRPDAIKPAPRGAKACYHERKRRAAAARLDQVIKAQLKAA